MKVYQSPRVWFERGAKPRQMHPDGSLQSKGATRKSTPTALRPFAELESSGGGLPCCWVPQIIAGSGRRCFGCLVNLVLWKTLFIIVSFFFSFFFRLNKKEGKVLRLAIWKPSSTRWIPPTNLGGVTQPYAACAYKKMDLWLAFSILSKGMIRAFIRKLLIVRL